VESYHSIDEEIVVVCVDDGCSLFGHILRVDDTDPVVHANCELIHLFGDGVEHAININISGLVDTIHISSLVYLHCCSIFTTKNN